MKTPEEIKKGLGACGSDECHGHHTDCPYEGDIFCFIRICRDARVYIQQLENQIGELAEAEKEDRAMVLLKACLTLLNKQKESHYVLNLLEQTVFYDGTDCDGDCLSEDIEDYLMEKGVFSSDEY